MSRSAELRAALESVATTLVVPDAYDVMSARIIASAGFQAIQCSGYSMALAAGWHDEAALGREVNVALTSRIVAAVDIPVMADGEDGYGGPEQVAATVRRFVGAGVAGLNLEDQVVGADRLIDPQEMVEKLRAAREAAHAAGDPGLVLNARSDALALSTARHLGLADAIERVNAYVRAGADLAFVTGVATRDEVRVLVKEVDGLVSVAAGLPYNVDTLTIPFLEREGVARVSLPTLAVHAAIGGIEEALAAVRRHALPAAKLDATATARHERLVRPARER